MLTFIDSTSLFSTSESNWSMSLGNTKLRISENNENWKKEIIILLTNCTSIIHNYNISLNLLINFNSLVHILSRSLCTFMTIKISISIMVLGVFNKHSLDFNDYGFGGLQQAFPWLCNIHKLLLVRIGRPTGWWAFEVKVIFSLADTSSVLKVFSKMSR